ncbi:MAG: dihydrodipicolinate synthase family protein [Proteobacteria bacterium]|nr:dihydrodipicolinate synthase family protein [Pseudomonadota bacterium]
MALHLSGGGVWPATLTPFAPEGGIDAAALQAHVAQVAGTRGVRAVVVNGHAGETSSLDFAERSDVIALAVEAASDVPVVAGVVAEDPRDARRLAREAAASGARGLLLFPPALFAHGAALRPDMVRRFVGDVAAASDLPIVLFQLSRASGQAFAPALVQRLCEEVPQIVAVKDGSDSPELYEDVLAVLRGLPRPVAMLTSNNGWLMASLACGGDGILSGLGSVAAPLLVALHEAMATGDLVKAREVNARLVPLCRAFYRAPGVDIHNRMKTALKLLGRLPHAAPRLPLLPLDDAETTRVHAALVATGLLTA